MLLALLVAPSFRSFLLHSYQLSQINTLTHAINFARSEALKRHAIITLCPSRDHLECSENWQEGWIIFIDHQGNGKVIAANDVLQVFNALPDNSVLEWRGALGKNYLQITPQGLTRQSGTFTFYPTLHDLKLKNEIIISPTSRVRVVWNN